MEGMRVFYLLIANFKSQSEGKIVAGSINLGGKGGESGQTQAGKQFTAGFSD
jgi:hypothetical protein